MEDFASCNIHCSHTCLFSFNLFPDSFSLHKRRVKIILNKTIYDDSSRNTDYACNRDLNGKPKRNA